MRTLRSARGVLGRNASVAVALMVAVAMNGGVAGATRGSHGQTTATAVIRGAHLSPNTPGVDVYLTSFAGGTHKFWLSNLGYGDFSNYRRIRAGIYAVAMRAHGASPSSPAALRWTIDAKPGHAYTVAAVGMNKHLRGIVLPDDLNPAARGHGRVRVIQAASRMPEATVFAQPHTVITKAARFATATGYTSVPAGQWTVHAKRVARAEPSATVSVRIRSGSVNSLVILDSSAGGIQLRSVLDAAGAALTPQGSVNAGGGGTAVVRATSDGVGWGLAVTLLLSIGAVAALRRRALTTRRVAR
jgi:hypothetical protein